jgi:hypothetical protein
VLEARTVREAARVVGVYRTTSFRWRHRFVPGAMRERPARLTVIVEADETYRLESQKGSRQLSRKPRKRGGVASQRGVDRQHDCLLVARDRTGQTLDFTFMVQVLNLPAHFRAGADAGSTATARASV